MLNAVRRNTLAFLRTERLPHGQRNERGDAAKDFANVYALVFFGKLFA